MRKRGRVGTCRYWNCPMTMEMTKNIALRPRIAKMLLVKTTNGSSVTAKMAGIESTAKIMSPACVPAGVVRCRAVLGEREGGGHASMTIRQAS